MDDLLEDLLQKINRLAPATIFLDDGNFTYVIEQDDQRTWNVRKMDNDVVIIDYTVKRANNSFYCNCPAGKFNRRCKHVVWVKTIVNSPVWSKLQR